jgi:hypothetical protein
MGRVTEHTAARQAAPPHPQLSLQRRAPSTLRRHLTRAAARLAILFVANLAVR